jgi:hypothetical protein
MSRDTRGRGNRNGAEPLGWHHPSGASSAMNNIIYIVGLVVIVLAILAFLGLR